MRRQTWRQVGLGQERYRGANLSNSMPVDDYVVSVKYGNLNEMQVMYSTEFETAAKNSTLTPPCSALMFSSCSSGRLHFDSAASPQCQLQEDPTVAT
jgi:hypothetical protein